VIPLDCTELVDIEFAEPGTLAVFARPYQNPDESPYAIGALPVVEFSIWRCRRGRRRRVGVCASVVDLATGTHGHPDTLCEDDPNFLGYGSQPFDKAPFLDAARALHAAWMTEHEPILGLTDKKPYEPPKRRPIRRSIPAGVRFAVFHAAGFRCVYCGRSVKEDGVRLVIDHIVPVSKGGTNDRPNLASACWECNAGKSAMLLDGGER
jgi:hypothetical protein